MHPSIAKKKKKKKKIKKGTSTIVSNAAEYNAHLADHFQAPNALMRYISSDKHNNRCLKRTYFCLAMRSASSRQILQFRRRYQRSDHHTHIE
jgi:hypothetical protein